MAGLAATNLAVQATAFVAGVVAARALGVGGRGDLAAVVLWPLLAANIATSGIDAALGVQAGRDKSPLGSLARIALLHAVIAGVLFIPAGLVLLHKAFPPARADLLRLAGVFLWIIPLHVLWMDMLGLDNGRQKYAAYNLTRVSFFALYLIGYVACWVSGTARLEYFVAAQWTALLLTVSVRVFCGVGPVRMGQPGRELVRRTARLAAGFTLSNAVMMLLVRIDVILVMLLFDTRTLGLYVVAQSLANVPALVSQAFAVRTFGTTAGAADESAFVSTVLKRFRLSSILTGATALVLALAAPWLLALLFGEPFREGAGVARVLFVASWLFNAGRIIDEGFRGRGRPMFGTLAFAGHIIVCTLGSLVATARGFGVLGVAGSVLTASVFGLVALVWAFRSQTGQSLFRAGGPDSRGSGRDTVNDSGTADNPSRRE